MPFGVLWTTQTVPARYRSCRDRRLDCWNRRPPDHADRGRLRCTVESEFSRLEIVEDWGTKFRKGVIYYLRNPCRGVLLYVRPCERRTSIDRLAAACPGARSCGASSISASVERGDRHHTILPGSTCRRAKHPQGATPGRTYEPTGQQRLRMELVVPPLSHSIRRGALAAVLQQGRAFVDRHALLLLVPASLGHYRSHLDCDCILRNRRIMAAETRRTLQNHRES